MYMCILFVGTCTCMYVYIMSTGLMSVACYDWFVEKYVGAPVSSVDCLLICRDNLNELDQINSSLKAKTPDTTGY